MFAYNVRNIGKKSREKEAIENAIDYVNSRDFKVGHEIAIDPSSFGDGKLAENSNPTRRKVTATRYNPVESQCNSQPLITADMSKISLSKLKRGKIRWIAVSRDLRKIYKYGDVVEIKAKDGDDNSINGLYEVHDTMNKRFTDRIDILTHIDNPHGQGKWEGVSIRLVKRKGEA
jgi:hypothetical protein